MLHDEPRLLERRHQAERRRARDAGTLRELGERQSRLAERERVQEFQRLRGGVHRVAAARDRLQPAFHWVKWYIAE